jgi:hypothetical protein
MRHRLCLRMASLICLGSFLITVWGCAAQPSRAGHVSRQTLAEFLQWNTPSTPPVPPESPTDEDAQLWTTIRARWPEVEHMLAARQALLSTPQETPGHTQQQTYVFDSRHIALIEGYARAHGFKPQEVIYAMCEEFFRQHGYIKGRSQ